MMAPATPPRRQTSYQENMVEEDYNDDWTVKSPATTLQRTGSRRDLNTENGITNKKMNHVVSTSSILSSPTSVMMMSQSLPSARKLDFSSSIAAPIGRISSVRYPCLAVSKYEDDDENVSISVRRLRESMRCEGSYSTYEESTNITNGNTSVGCSNNAVVNAIRREDFKTAQKYAQRDGNLGEEAIACYALQEYPQALTCVHQALSSLLSCIDGNDSQQQQNQQDVILLYTLLALIQYDMGQGLKARATLEEAYQYSKNNTCISSDSQLWQLAHIQLNLALVLWKQKNSEAALQLLEESLLLQQSAQLQHVAQQRRIKTTQKLLSTWRKEILSSTSAGENNDSLEHGDYPQLQNFNDDSFEFLLPLGPLWTSTSPTFQLPFILTSCTIHDEELNDIYQRATLSHVNNKYDDWKTSLELLTQQLENPDDINPSRVYLCIGLVHLHSKHYSLAQASFQKAIGLASDNYSGVESTLDDDGYNSREKKKIQDAYLKSLAFLWLGLSYLANEQDYNLALEACSNALHLRRSQWGYTHTLALTALYHVGICHLLLGGHVAALKSMEEILEVNKNEVQVYVTKGCIHHYALDSAASICTLEEALSLERRQGGRGSLALDNLAYCMAYQNHSNLDKDDEKWQNRMRTYQEMLSMT